MDRQELDRNNVGTRGKSITLNGPYFALGINLKRVHNCQVWWNTPLISEFRRLRQKNQEFEASLGYIARPVSKKEKKKGPGTVAYTSNPSYSRSRVRRIMVKGQPGEKDRETSLSTNKLLWCHPSYLGGIGRRTTVQGQSRQKLETLSEKPH
jgi:hypothetical protein